MPGENVEIVRPLYEDAAEGRFATHLHLFHPEVEYVRTGDTGVGLTGSWRGVEAMLRAAYEWVSTFERLRVAAERYIEAGDSVLVLTRQWGTARGSGLPIDAQLADLLTLEDGLIVRVVQFRDRAEAFEAAGVPMDGSIE